ncbi:MAG: 1-acyl-sn-glycerol-3-phosphate acyltransferase [Bacteroidales bacterium]|nr:1-acyl-sn-glycerol-3-phosphate acyltransferase [Bacteroidales bacterium]
MNKKFNEIRSYNDSEVTKIIKKLCKEKVFINLITQFNPTATPKLIIEKLQSIKTIYDFQIQVLYPMAKTILRRSSSGITYSGLENVRKDVPYLFISNHRDIILDPALLNYIFFQNGYDTCYIAIGNNLLIYSWINDLVKLAKCFVVKRNIPFSQIFDQSKILSSYIRYIINEQKDSVWISQREGRTKDGDDKTHSAVLKMLSLSSNKPIVSSFEELNILPVSISYEYEPCDFLKATETYKKLINNSYKKTPKEDLKSMITGIVAQKGRIHFNFGKALKPELKTLSNIDNKPEQLRQIALMIDDNIYANYKLWETNYIAYDLLNKTNSFADKYSEKAKDAFASYIDKIVRMMKEESLLIEDFLLEIYANPVKNILSLKK